MFNISAVERGSKFSVLLVSKLALDILKSHYHVQAGYINSSAKHFVPLYYEYKAKKKEVLLLF